MLKKSKGNLEYMNRDLEIYKAIRETETNLREAVWKAVIRKEYID